MPGGHRPNIRAVKKHRSYTVEEAARALGICKGTVRRWIKAGLPALTDRKPVLILGEDLTGWLKARKTPPQRCEPGECYCVKCRAPRKAAGGMAELVPLNATGGNLRALCETCGTLMHRRVSNAQLEAFSAFLDVTTAQAETDIKKSA
jgi:excisionase family DNA binding protein